MANTEKKLDQYWKKLANTEKKKKTKPIQKKSATRLVLAGVFYIDQDYEGESISNQPNLFPVEIHLFFFNVIAL